MGMFSTPPASSIDTASMAGAAKLEAAKAKLKANAGSFENEIAKATRLHREMMEAGKGKADEKVRAAAGKAVEQLREVAQMFESYFLNMLIKKMRGEKKENSLFKDSPGHNTFSGMQDEAYAKEMSKSGVFGIAEMVMNQYQRQVEGVAAMKAARTKGKD